MSVNRRAFLKAGVIAAAMAAVPRPLMAQFGRASVPVPPIDDPQLQDLIARALEAARGAGANYADVRLTHTRTRRFFSLFTYDDESMEVGVRSLVDGYWGFASSAAWNPDEMARLGRESVHQARTNALGKTRTVELAPVPVVQDGNWVMPVQTDPFEISPFEAQDLLGSLDTYSRRIPGAGSDVNQAAATVQSKAFASTLGSHCTQRWYRTEGVLTIKLQLDNGRKNGEFALDCLSPAGLGWELYAADRIPYVRDGSLFEEIRRGTEELRESMMLPVKPVDAGRYDAVFDARSMATLLDTTLGRATELDRALGYEANAGGTSYLNDPLSMLGRYQAGAPILNVTANRTETGGCATVKWDDEGVVPDEFALVKNGMLVDFQTTRESAGWLKEYYAKTRTPAHSHGSAGAPSAMFAPLQHTPNLVLSPGRDALDFDALVKGVEKGIAIKGANLDMDFQWGSGLGTGSVYEVKQGKIVASIASAGFLFRATELWKGLHALGSDASARRHGVVSDKGEPAQRVYHSVTAPPGLVSDLTLIDPQRKA